MYNSRKASFDSQGVRHDQLDFLYTSPPCFVRLFVHICGSSNFFLLGVPRTDPEFRIILWVHLYTESRVHFYNLHRHKVGALLMPCAF
jgi:hypothetical protein